MSRNARFQRALLRVLPIALAVGLAVGIQSAGLTDALDRRLSDALVRHSPVPPPAAVAALPDVAVVTIDPRSLRAFDDWPWPRSRHAEAVERLAAAGARAIAFDIDFSSASSPSEDARLAEAIRAHGRVVLATFSQFQTVEAGAVLEIASRPIPELAEGAAALGSVLVPIDPDGVVRHAPRESPIQSEAIPSLARSSLRVAVGPEWEPRVRAAHHASTATRVDFRRTRPGIPTLPYLDLLEGRFEPGLFAGRVVFVGATAAEFQDLWATPVSPALPGVMIQAIAYRTAAAEVAGEPVLADLPAPWLYAGYAALALLLWPRSGRTGLGRLAWHGGVAAGGVALTGWSVWVWGLAIPLSVGLALVGFQYAIGLEGLQKRIQQRIARHESSLRALATLGSAAARPRASDGTSEAGPDAGLWLALELLGEVVEARGVVLLRASARGRLTGERLEWQPPGAPSMALEIDEGLAEQALARRRPVETQDPRRPDVPVVYSPLVAADESVGVLVVLCREGGALDALQRRTIATVGAQMALTAQNLLLIERLRETFESSIAAVASAVEARDGYTDQHCRRLAAFSSLMGRRLGMPENEIRAMELGALLHDVGKIGIPDAILNKNGRLSNEERATMQRHPEIGAGIVAPVVGLEQTTLDCVVHHHERWNGTGYPEGLAGEEIPLAARIVSIVDVWDALSSSRPYKRAFSQAEARDLLLKGRGSQFDPELIDLFFEVLEEQGEQMLELIARSSTSGVVER